MSTILPSLLYSADVCDNSVTCAKTIAYTANKHRNVLGKRVTHYANAIARLKMKVAKGNELLGKESYEYVKLKTRFEIRLIETMKTNHYLRKIKREELSSGSIDTLRIQHLITKGSSK